VKALVCDTGPLLAALDHRHMHAVKPAHCDGFELLPG